MDFDTACKRCKPGEYFKSSKDAWNEYGIQFGKDPEGNVFWTAGYTAGGKLTPQLRRRLVGNDDYQVYTYFGNNPPPASHPEPAVKPTTKTTFDEEEVFTDRLTELYPEIARAARKAQNRYLIYLDAHPRTYGNEEVIKTVTDCMGSVITAISDLLPSHDDDSSLAHFYFEQINN